MSFAQAIFLLGMIGVIGPILAHLLARPRYRRVLFTMLDFLEVGKKDAYSRRHIRNLLLLLLRCSIIVLLAMLFAGPRLAATQAARKPSHVYYIGLDDSASMSYVEGSLSRFDAARGAAEDLIRQADDDAVFNINALSCGRWGRNLGRDAALTYLGTLKALPLSAKLDEFLSEVGAAARQRAPNVRVIAALISDFTPKMMVGLAAVTEPVTVDDMSYTIVAAMPPVRNTAVTGARVERTAQKGLWVTVTAVNYGSEPVTKTLLAKISDATVARSQLSFDAGQQRAVSLEVPIDLAAGGAPCVPIEFSLPGDDCLAMDDTHYLAVSLPELKVRNVVLFGRDPRETFLLKTALASLSAGSGFEPINVREVHYNAFEPAAFKTASTVIFASAGSALSDSAGSLESFLRGGGRAIFFLSPDSDANALGRLSKSGLIPAFPRQLKTASAIIEPGTCAPNAFGAPGESRNAAVLQDYPLDRIFISGFYECEPSNDAIVLWKFRDGPGFMYSQRVGNGLSILVNTSADDSLGGLLRSNASVAFSRFLLGASVEPVCNAFTCGEVGALPAVQAEIDAARAGKPVWVTKPSGETSETAVANALVLVECPDAVGWISTLAKPVRRAGVNLPEGETDVAQPSPEAVSQMIAKALVALKTDTGTAASGDEGKTYKPIWRYFAWALLVLVLAEAFIANRTQR